MPLWDFVKSWFKKRAPVSPERAPRGQSVQTVTFPPLQTATLDGVRFQAEVDGKRITCEISTEALQDHFGLQGSEYLDAFLASRGRIQIVAERLIRAGRIDADGIPRIRSQDV